MRIGIPAIPCGNFASVIRMVQKAGGQAELVTSPAELSKFQKIILAGVGSFDHGMQSLSQAGWIDALNDAVYVRNSPILGICLGMQLMCNSSEEGELSGLGWMNAEVKRFDFQNNTDLKIPHMGWNVVNPKRDSTLFQLRDEEEKFYHVHSFHVSHLNPEFITATTHYGYEFISAFQNENILGVQFHPEKSHRYGMNLFKRFIDLQ